MESLQNSDFLFFLLHLVAGIFSFPSFFFSFSFWWEEGLMTIKNLIYYKSLELFLYAQIPWFRQWKSLNSINGLGTLPHFQSQKGILFLCPCLWSVIYPNGIYRLWSDATLFIVTDITFLGLCGEQIQDKNHVFLQRSQVPSLLAYLLSSLKMNSIS